MLSEARQKKIMEKLNRAQKCSILGPQNLGSGGGPGPRGPPPGSAPGAVTYPFSLWCKPVAMSGSYLAFHRSDWYRKTA